MNTNLEIILQSITDAFFLIDQNWIIKKHNFPAQEIFPEQKLLNNSFKELFDLTTNTIAQTSYKTQDTLLHRNFEITIYPSKDAEAYVIVKKELASKKLSQLFLEQKRIEAALKQEKEFSRQLVRTSLDGIFAFNLECNYTIWNPAMEKLTGVKSPEVIGKHAFDLFPFLRENNEAFYMFEAIQGRSNLAKNRPYFIPQTSKEGIWEAYYSPLRNNKNEIIGSLAIVKDTTAITNKEILLRKDIETKQKHEIVTLEKLNEIERIISQETNIKTIIQMITNTINQLVGAEFGVFFSNCEDNIDNSLIISEDYSFNNKEYSSLVQINKCLLRVFDTPFTLKIDEVQLQSEQSSQLTQRLILFLQESFSMKSYLIIPVISSSGKFFGSLLFAHNNKSIFEERDEKIASNLSLKAANIIDSLELIESYKLKQEKAEQSEQHHRLLSQSIPQMVWTTDKSGQIDFFNHRLTQYTGLDSEQIKKGKLHNITHPEDRERVAQRWKQSLLSGEPYEDEFRWKQALDGNYYWQLARAIPFKDNEGNIIKWFGTTTNINKQKKGEEALKESQAQFRGLFESNIIGIFSIDANNKIIEANDAFLQCVGYSRSDLLAGEINWLDLALPQYRQVNCLQNLYSKENGILSTIEQEYVKKDRSQVSVFVGASLAEGDTTKAIAFILDISEWKELEKRKDEFISMASHELKTPVTTTKVFTQMLLKMFEDKEEKEKNKEPLLFLTKMDEQINKLSKLIADLLNISKMQSGKLEFYKEQIEIDDLIQETIEHCQLSTRKHNIIFKTKSKVQVHADRNRIEQVLVNLITNAIKYSPNTEEIIVKAMVQENEVQVSIQDFGIGISEEHQSKIFNRFYRVFEENERTFPGLGIGLYISSEIVKYHGGNIWVDSTKGRGSTLTFSLPLKVGIIEP